LIFTFIRTVDQGREGGREGEEEGIPEEGWGSMIFREKSSNNIRIKVFSILKLARLCLRYVLFFWCDFLLILTALSLVGGQSQYMAVGLSSPLSKSSFILFYSWCLVL